MKKLLIIIPIIILVLSACSFKEEINDTKDIKQNENKNTEIELDSVYLNQYSQQVLDFSHNFELIGDLPLGLNIMPVLDLDSKLELYGLAKEGGEFTFYLKNDEFSQAYKLNVLVVNNDNFLSERKVKDDCKTFFDGCNTCTKEPNSEVMVCTEIYCEVYSDAYCLD
jgi:hypothetical protein